MAVAPIPATNSVGIVGAGKVGTVLARLASDAGYQVSISGSGDQDDIELIVSVLAPGARAVTTQQVLQDSDIVILALPLGRFREIPADDTRGKLLIDAMNYWWETDGVSDEFGGVGASTSELVQAHFTDAAVVKAFNHVGYHDLDEKAKPAGSPERLAIAIVGDDPQAVSLVRDFVDSLGFDPLPIGGLPQGVRIQPFTDAFGATTDREGLQKIVDGFRESDRGREVIAALGEDWIPLP